MHKAKFAADSADLVYALSLDPQPTVVAQLMLDDERYTIVDPVNNDRDVIAQILALPSPATALYTLARHPRVAASPHNVLQHMFWAVCARVRNSKAVDAVLSAPGLRPTAEGNFALALAVQHLNDAAVHTLLGDPRICATGEWGRMLHELLAHIAAAKSEDDEKRAYRTQMAILVAHLMPGAATKEECKAFFAAVSRTAFLADNRELLDALIFKRLLVYGQEEVMATMRNRNITLYERMIRTVAHTTHDFYSNLFRELLRPTLTPSADDDSRFAYLRAFLVHMQVPCSRSIVDALVADARLASSSPPHLARLADESRQRIFVWPSSDVLGAFMVLAAACNATDALAALAVADVRDEEAKYAPHLAVASGVALALARELPDDVVMRVAAHWPRDVKLRAPETLEFAVLVAHRRPMEPLLRLLFVENTMTRFSRKFLASEPGLEALRRIDDDDDDDKPATQDEWFDAEVAE